MSAVMDALNTISSDGYCPPVWRSFIKQLAMPTSVVGGLVKRLDVAVPILLDLASGEPLDVKRQAGLENCFPQLVLLMEALDMQVIPDYLRPLLCAIIAKCDDAYIPYNERFIQPPDMTPFSGDEGYHVAYILFVNGM
jgi:hypothetical protein